MKKFILLIVISTFSFLPISSWASIFYESYSGPINAYSDDVVIGQKVEMLGGYINTSLWIYGALTVKSGGIASGVPISTYIEDGTLNLRGGTLNDLGIRLSSAGTLNIYGHGFISYYDEIANLHIAGFLEDNNPFSVLVWEYQTNQNPGDTNLVPEPATLSLFALSTLAFLRRNKS